MGPRLLLKKWVRGNHRGFGGTAKADSGGKDGSPWGQGFKKKSTTGRREHPGRTKTQEWHRKSASASSGWGKAKNKARAKNDVSRGGVRSKEPAKTAPDGRSNMAAIGG